MSLGEAPTRFFRLSKAALGLAPVPTVQGFEKKFSHLRRRLERPTRNSWGRERKTAEGQKAWSRWTAKACGTILHGWSGNMRRLEEVFRIRRSEGLSGALQR